jgi:branched-subunit amino acid aminotransferase/4-amino-4-deoxychorismate lyase
MDAGKIVCLNGEYLPAGEAAVPAADQGLLFGRGLFETVRVSGGVPRLVGRHLSRLRESAGELGLELPYQPGELEDMLRRTAEKNGMDGGGLRLTLTAGGHLCRPTLLIQARGRAYTGEMYRRGIKAGLAPFPRNEGSPLVRHKTLNYWENLLARRLAAQEGWGEALFLNCSGSLAEGSVSNLFLVLGGKVVTPDAGSGLLPGITRRRVLELCAALKIPLEERAVGPGELRRADECFITNALMGVMPVTALENSPVGNGLPGEVAGLIASELEKATE